MYRTREAERELEGIFRSSATKHEANRRAKTVLEQLSRDPGFLTAVLEKYLTTRGSLDNKNYPVVGMTVAANPSFGLVANCWIPLPGRETHISTKMIHHHGDMLLSTVTLFGPGYEHWMFTLPKPLPGSSGRFRMELLERAPHGQHHVSFVDAWTAHVPLYPPSLSITLALWTSRFQTTWRDRVKRLKVFQGREERIKKLALRLGLRKSLDLKVVESFDYYPAADRGFHVMPERTEFELGPNEDHVASVFHVLQQTGNEHLARTVRRTLAEGGVTNGRRAVEELTSQLERGTPIEGRLSKGHYGVPHANFTREDIERALRTSSSHVTEGENDGGKLIAETRREATAGAGPR